MKKKLFKLSVFLVVFFLPLKGWGNSLLELDDTEREGKKLARVYRNVRGFFQENKTEIETLIKAGFFHNPSDEQSSAFVTTLSHIKQNRNCSIIKTYGDNYRELANDLRVLSYALKSSSNSDLQEKELKDFGKYIQSILRILRYIDINKLK